MSNSYHAKFKIGFKKYSIPCDHIELSNGMTVIYGIPEYSQIGFITILAVVPNTVFVQLIFIK